MVYSWYYVLYAYKRRMLTCFVRVALCRPGPCIIVEYLPIIDVLKNKRNRCQTVGDLGDLYL